jgi:hypothetical protein
MAQPRSQPNDRYREIKVLRDSDGVVAVITERLDSEQPYHSFCFAKEFLKDGVVHRTNYLSRRHTAAIRRLMTQVEDYLDQLVEQNYARVARGAR